jgi:hypothetical protein
MTFRGTQLTGFKTANEAKIIEKVNSFMQLEYNVSYLQHKNIDNISNNFENEWNGRSGL